jgi:threonine/homoserine/homoserine lactone efflux protein
VTDPLLFALAVLAILATPGPTNTLLATGGAARGLRRGLPLVAAEAAGYLLSISLVGFLLRPVVAQAPLLAASLRLAVGAYLILLAARLATPRIEAAAAVVDARRVFVTTMLNPKAFVFALAIVPFAQPGVWRYLAGFVAILLPVSVAWVAFGAVLGRVSSRRGRLHWVTRAGACAIAAFAVLVIVPGARVLLSTFSTETQT